MISSGCVEVTVHIALPQGRGNLSALAQDNGRKRHVIVDTMGLLLVVAVTSASVQDRAGGRTVLARLAKGFRTISLVRADGGYANSVDSTLLSSIGLAQSAA
nr:transposase [Streptomyces sp. NBC_00830]